MSSLDETHVYRREIQEDKRSSLSLLVDLVQPESHVLDVGIGGGALGAYLREHKSCVLDGVTYNAEEAASASANYRDIKVADLDACTLTDLFGERRYRHIVCADVLEHLRDPVRVLNAARQLLEDGGSLLVSVPNVAYPGLIAELLSGQFRYRREGLLDQTHVRFFTRQSLLTLLAEQGWRAKQIDTVDLDLADSEFTPALELLPPAVRSQLLAHPDGMSYQFVVEAECAAPGEVVDNSRLQTAPAHRMAHYVLSLYHAGETGYEEQRKIEALAQIGEEAQRVAFHLPPERVFALRVDPAERPGCMYLYDIRLLDAAGVSRWRWDGQASSLQAACHQIVLSSAWLGGRGGALLFVGDDPHIMLPIPQEALALAAGGQLVMELSWPMSADFRLLAERTAPIAQTLEATEAQLRTTSFERDVAQARVHEGELALENAKQHLAQVSGDCTERVHVLEADQASLRLHLAEVETNSRQLGTTHEALHAEHVRTRRELLNLAEKLSEAQAYALRCQSEREEVVRHIDAIQNSTVFRLTRPLVFAKMRLDRLRGAGRRSENHMNNMELKGGVAAAPLADGVDVIVPVYRGLSDTRCCVESVLASPVRTPFRLVLINDCSPEPEVTEYLRTLPALDPRVLLLENEENLGFVGTVNRGMALDAQRDVLLLNSDAEVANDWLDRIRATAYSMAGVSSVTPMSNNATICSYPKFCEGNDLPQGWDTARLDKLCAQVNPGVSVEVPTGIGFCMYIRRDSLAQVGLFDVENFGKGYGEENDFCMRSRKAGFRHLYALDTFVRHAGGVSFGEAKTPRERDAVTTLCRLYPDYERVIHAHVTEDPARLARLRLDFARIHQQALPAILAITHSRGGGTERHVRELAELLRDKALCFALKPLPDGITELSWIAKGEAFKLSFRLPADFDALVEILRSLGVAHVHIHHLIGHDPSVWGLAERLGVRYDYTVHDYYAICPQISLTDHTDRYCGEQGLEQCRGCLRRRCAPGGVSIDTWRGNFGNILTQARYVITPSQDAADRVAHYAPKAAFRVVPHKDLVQDCPAPTPCAVAPERSLRVAVIGALGPIKGADLLEAVAKLAAERAMPIEFHLLGYGYRPMLTQPKASLTVHGAYDDADLDSLLAWLKPDLVWFPALWPETYSYTLSACLKVGLPVAVPNLGAFAERIAGRAWSWLCPWSMSAREYLDFFVKIRSEHFLSATPPACVVNSAPSAKEFDYREGYFSGIVARPSVPEISDEMLSKYLVHTPVGVAAMSKGTRGAMLSAFVRIRRAPIMRWTVGQIPLEWQTRLKNWLLK